MASGSSDAETGNGSARPTGLKHLTPQVIILLAEDEALIQAMVTEVLEDAGFAVVPVSDGTEAISRLDAEHQNLAGLISDIRLGSGPNGWEIARHARELRPDLPVVYMTADSGAEWAANGVPKSVLVQKPFAPAQIVTAIATLINEAGSQPGKI